MKRYILTAMAVACLGTLNAQETESDVLIVHFKDGTKLSLPCGQTRDATISFWGAEDGAQLDELKADVNSQQEAKGWGVADWGYNPVTKRYGVVIYYSPVGVPVDYDSFLLFGTTPGLNFETAESRVGRSDMLPIKMKIGHVGNNYQLGAYYDYSDYTDYSEALELKYLKYGQTYYYRPGVTIKYEEGGESHSTYYFGKEQSFRIPLLMRDSGLIPEEYIGEEVTFPSAEAWEEFNTLYLKEKTLPIDLVAQWWQQWMQTDEGKSCPMGDVTDHQFDDGILHQVNHVPEAFHSWLASRETVLNRPEQVELGVLEMASGEVKDIMTCELVENVDPALGLPGNSYMAFDPIQVVSNISVSAQPIVVGGQTYKLRLVMAPETRYENTEENAELLLPTKIRVNLGNAIVEPSVDVSATETTVLEYEYTAESIASLQIITRVTNSQMKLGNYNRHFRLLEVRLTPVGTAQE